MLNARRPKLIVAYADAMHQLARFCEEEGVEVAGQTPVITSATTLHSFMRERIERIFRARVFNRYGSRELGDIACEDPGKADEARSLPRQGRDAAQTMGRVQGNERVITT